MDSIEEINHIFYINLLHRTDRNFHVQQQLEKVGFKNFIRFNAIELKNGAIGCTLSHIKLIEYAIEKNLPHVLIVEDDIFFTNPEQFKNSLNGFLKSKIDFDVLLFAGNNVGKTVQINDFCVKVSQCQTTTGYLVKNNYFKTLLENFKNGLNLFIHNTSLHTLFAIDKYWFNLQMIHNWYLLVPLTVTQISNYSDIEKRNTNYDKVMLTLNKKYI